MNFRAGFVVMVLFFVSFLVSESEGLRCYSCRYCNDPFDSGDASIVDCSTSCAKAKGPEGVVRFCSPAKGADSCTEVSSEGQTGDVCVCNSDLCNGSSMQIISYSAAAITLFVSYVLKFAM